MPAASTATRRPVGSGGVAGKATMRASRLQHGPGQRVEQRLGLVGAHAREQRAGPPRPHLAGDDEHLLERLGVAEHGLREAPAGGAVVVEPDEVRDRGRRGPAVPRVVRHCASGTDLQLGQRERPRLDAREVERDVPEPGGPDGVDDGLPQRVGGDRCDVVRRAPRPAPPPRGGGRGGRRARAGAAPASAASTWASLCGVTSSKCGIREARHGAAGLSADGSARARAMRRTAALSRPASASGVRTSCSRAACAPGRSGRRASSAFSPYATAASPWAATTSAEIRVKSSFLQK